MALEYRNHNVSHEDCIVSSIFKNLSGDQVWTHVLVLQQPSMLPLSYGGLLELSQSERNHIVRFRFLTFETRAFAEARGFCLFTCVPDR